MTLLAGRYEVRRPLGHGGMAVVELAHDVELDRTVAIKLLAENLAREDELRHRFLREAQLAARLAHPNVVRIYDLGEADGRPYIVMEYVEGDTLAAILAREGTLAAERAAALCLQAAAGLAAAHAIGLVHRDVKPQNLLVRSSDGVVKVADFGIARLDGGTRLTLTGTVLGTTPYVAPEQVLGEPVTPAADVYALGSVLYESLTGVPPRRAGTLAELGARLEEPVRPVRELAPETPLELERVLMRCLARHPQYRPQTAAHLATELARLVADPPTQPLTRPTAVAAPLPSSPRKRRVVAAILAIVVLAVAVPLVILTVVAGGGSGNSAERRPPPPVLPVPHSNDPAQEARNLARWLRQNSD